ncbi:hypothetical protein [Pseudomonas svalbardensis]|uniref:hypothetical protein n=1 Tax=Pseudomonas svalbardensis TaxID=3042029 RepID=UPI0024B3C615|nr:hypothetical protein [Pseudomonas sp. PMCC200367]
MSTKDIFIPKGNSIQAPGNDFHWNFGSEVTRAEKTLFFLHEFPPTGELSWVMSGITGTLDDENYFSFKVSVPYIDDTLLERTYKLGDELDVSHSHSIPAPPGFTGFRFVDADNAELTIRLDPIKGTVQGDFNAIFRSEGYRLNPNGTFKLTRDDQ